MAKQKQQQAGGNALALNHQTFIIGVMVCHPDSPVCFYPVSDTVAFRSAHYQRWIWREEGCRGSLFESITRFIRDMSYAFWLTSKNFICLPVMQPHPKNDWIGKIGMIGYQEQFRCWLVYSSFKSSYIYSEADINIRTCTYMRSSICGKTIAN